MWNMDKHGWNEWPISTILFLGKIGQSYKRQQRKKQSIQDNIYIPWAMKTKVCFSHLKKGDLP